MNDGLAVPVSGMVDAPPLDMQSPKQTPPDKKPTPRVAVVMTALFTMAVLVATVIAAAGYPRDEAKSQPSTMEQPAKAP